MVRLEEDFDFEKAVHVPNFNSKMVRLEVNWTSKVHKTKNKFQFQNGTIRR